MVGRSRGGWTTKFHLAADGKCHPLCCVPTAGQAAAAVVVAAMSATVYLAALHVAGILLWSNR